MTKNLPIYEMVINPDETSDVEVSFVALVDKPAIEKNFIAFKENEVLKMDFAVNEEQRIISGPAMVANSLIYRNDAQGEYQVFFSKETIGKIALKFFKKDYHKNLNLFHDPTLSLEGVTIFESFVTDSQRGIQPMKGFENVPDGTWFISAKVENDDVWNSVKSGKVKGFSVEGIFSYIKNPSVLNGTDSHNSHFNENTFMSELKELFKALKDKFIGEPAQAAAPVAPVAAAAPIEYKLKDGTVITCDKLEAGGIMMIGDAPAPPAEYELEDGTKVYVTDGGVIEKIETVAPVEPMATDYAPKFAEIESKFSAYETKFTEQNGLIEGLKGIVNKQNEMLTGLFSIVEKLADIPTGDPVTENKNSFHIQKPDREAKIKDLTKLINQIKNK